MMIQPSAVRLVKRVVLVFRFVFGEQSLSGFSAQQFEKLLSKGQHKIMYLNVCFFTLETCLCQNYFTRQLMVIEGGLPGFICLC